MKVVKLVILFIYCSCAYSFDDDEIIVNNDDIVSNIDMPATENEDWSSIDEDYYPTLLNDVKGMKVAALVAQTGDAGFLGQVVQAGFEKAVSDLKQLCSNERCEVPQVNYFNTRSSSEKALKLFKKLYHSKGYRTFIGFVTSDEAQMVAEYAKGNAPDAILFSPTSTATDLCKYKNLNRMTMDDRGYAEVLFDLCVHFKERESNLSIQVIHRDDTHGNGLADDIKKRFSQASKEGYQVFPHISYKPTQGRFTHSNVITQLLATPLAKEKHSLIVLVGLSETQVILQEAAKHPSLKRHTWVLSDALTLSNIQIPHDMNVFGLSFVGDETSSRLLNKERRGLKQYLRNKKLPPMSQAQLAYDVITAVQKSKTQCHSNSNMLTEGLTGPLEFSRCKDRTTGSYAFVVSPKKHDVDNVLRKVVMPEKWISISYFNVESNDRNFNQFSMLEDLSPDMIMEVELESTSKKGVSSVASPSVEVKKSDLLKHLVEIDDKTCNKNALLTVTTFGDVPMSYTVLVANMPESLVFPMRLGFILNATCHTGNNLQYTLTQVCPATKIGGSEVMCQRKVETTAVGKRLNAEGVKPGCISSGVATVACFAGVAGCFVASIPTAGVPIALCGAGAAGCGGLSVATGVVCSNEKPKFVCTELFRQGYLPSDIMLADMSFAGHYSADNPITRKGYDILGPKVASWMSSSELVTNLAKSIAIPWAEEMAYHEGYRETGNDFGALVMSIGSIVCGLVGAVYIYSNYIMGGVLVIILIAAGVVAKRIKFAQSFVPTTGSLAKKIN